MKWKYFLILFPLLLLRSELSAQRTFPADYFWLNAGMGNNTLQGQSMYLSFSVQMKKQVFNVSFVMNEEELQNPFVRKNPDIFIHDISLQYGKRWSQHYGFIALTAGLSLISGKDRGALQQRVTYMRNRTYELYSIKNISTIGIPLRMQMHVTPVKWLGIGITLQGNLNARLPYAAVMISGSVGRVNKNGAFW